MILSCERYEEETAIIANSISGFTFEHHNGVEGLQLLPALCLIYIFNE